MENNKKEITTTEIKKIFREKSRTLQYENCKIRTRIKSTTK